MKKHNLYKLYTNYHSSIHATAGPGVPSAINKLNYHFNKVLKKIDPTDTEVKDTSIRNSTEKYDLLSPESSEFEKMVKACIDSNIHQELKRAVIRPIMMIQDPTVGDGEKGEKGEKGDRGDPTYIGEITDEKNVTYLRGVAMVDADELELGVTFLLESNLYIVMNQVGSQALFDVDYNIFRDAILNDIATNAGNVMLYLPGLSPHVIVGGSGGVFGGSGTLYDKMGYWFKIIIIIIILFLVIYIIFSVYNGVVAKGKRSTG